MPSRLFILSGLWLFGCTQLACSRQASTGSASQAPKNDAQAPRIDVKLDVGQPKTTDADPLVSLLADELKRQWDDLKKSGEQSPELYFLAYDVVDEERLYVGARRGAVYEQNHSRSRSLDVDVRVGDHTLDSGHIGFGSYAGNGLGVGANISMDDTPAAIRQALWIVTESQYRDALEAYESASSEEQVRTRQAAETHPDFSHEKAQQVYLETPGLDFAAMQSKWEAPIKDVSAQLGRVHERAEVDASFEARHLRGYFVNSEGTRIQRGANYLRILLSISLQSDDGMELGRVLTYDAQHPSELPSAAELKRDAQDLVADIQALGKAPIAEPYSGPAILEGRAAAVFFHEIFGHRLEGHRQKDDSEGQTFTSQLNQSILPGFLDIIDDPRVARLNGTPLNGHYLVDDEGVSAQKTVLVDAGVLSTFLLSRSPVRPFLHSNGHGRRQPGNAVVARQGNLIINSGRALDEAALRQRLLEEVQQQGKPYGLRFVDIDGGFTTTHRGGPQAFKVNPRLVYRVYPDGRPDELVRGVDIVGTPLAAFETIEATGDRLEIFNGYCGAESGWVPVSASSPALLLRQIEIERTVHDRLRPPLLPAPSNNASSEQGTPR